MAKSIALNYTDSGVSGVTTLKKDIAILNFKSDYRVKSDEPSEAVIANITSPIDRPESFRFAMTNVADIYKGSGIDSGFYSPSRKGISLLCQLNDVYKYDDSADSTFKAQYLPISGHIVLKAPCNEALTDDMISTFVGRLVAGLYNSGVLTSDRLKAMLRGSLLPSDM